MVLSIGGGQRAPLLEASPWIVTASKDLEDVWGVGGGTLGFGVGGVGEGG